ncbi:SCO1664 family protein [Arthrobacter sp. zg-Y820]|uniref:SCO1664 family protein n=1 Tax=unclassified Arthrobacter TaxID=235627 RepID=UPI001E373883|nr:MULTISPECIES: SCO1664 family protein [unclassified Arthrobacter]MCC9198266.1 SCO1664 family protein [Arthrobacter sp. zg-Y820]MDK1281135.1 SCO1664 family protein [Arthrobacter sp. zg.Y820]WIB09731.1 SCO1664 family protein [Arthrobacter sp. zg-Y820]
MPAPDLVAAELTLTGRITTASNATFLGSIGGAAVVYKPIAGEQPLWDFPDGCLAHREVAAYLVSEALGWNIVPRTWLRDGPFGEGMVQLWQDTDPEQTAVDLVPADDVPDTGWKQVLEGEDQSGRTVALIHEDTPALRRMAVFDVLVNNADRKGDHILAMGGGHRYGVDHGLTLHSDHKLRTVLWGWIGEALSAEELDGVDRILSGLEGELGLQLAKLLTAEEIASLAARCVRLRSAGQFPAPSGDMPAVPWPLF